MKYVIGADIGTGSVKAVAMSQEDKSMQVCQRHYSFDTPRPGWFEQDPEQIWDAFKIVIKNMVTQTGLPPSGIGLSSAMHSLIAVDKSGRPLAPMITWADNRSAEVARTLRASEKGNELYHATGTPLHAMSPLCKLIWIREHDNGLLNRAHKFISIKEYIWYHLFKEFKIDHSIASCTGLFNIHRRRWEPDALALAGITEQALSEPVPTGYTRTYQPSNGDPQLSFLPAIPFVIGASDGCLANPGSGAHEHGSVAITIGTSGAVRVTSNQALPDRETMPFSYILDEKTFICGGPINNGGLALQWWLKNINPPGTADNDYNVIFQQIENIDAGSNGLIFIPYITGERAPVWDSESCGLFFGARLQHGQAHFSRAVLEGICYAIKDVLDTVGKNMPPFTPIYVSGGMVRSEAWMQMLADITGNKLVLVPTEDASAAGAAMMAMGIAGINVKYPLYDPEDVKMIEPDKKKSAVYAGNFSIYKALYPVLKDTMHRLYRMNS